MKIERYTRYCMKHLQLTKKALLGTDEKTTSKYFKENKIYKLQIGCGNNLLEGWLNADLRPPLDGAIHLDATKQFPFEDSTFDYIFSEHMIEHINYQEGINMLSECYRILKPGGKIRISTPDLSFLFELHKSSKSEVQSEYLKWSFDVYNIPEVSSNIQDTMIINNFVRDWGHKFIYDQKTLNCSLEKIGFTDSQKYSLCESEDKQLQGLENINRMPHDFLKLETMVFEGTKPMEREFSC